MTSSDDKPQFLLLLRQPNGGVPPPDELQRIMARFAEWMRRMSDQGMVVATNGLDVGGKVLRGPRGKLVSDGPFVEGKEIVGGYVLIAADTLDDALDAARGCPGLDYNMAVEVRPVRSPATR